MLKKKQYIYFVMLLIFSNFVSSNRKQKLLEIQKVQIVMLNDILERVEKK